MRLETPEKIRNLQRKLYCKAKTEPAFRFYLLYDKICREDVLLHAYALARANAGAPGADGTTFEQIDAEGAEVWLAGLRWELVLKTYRADPVRRVMIPKPGGGERPLGIPTIRDRVIQTAAKLVLEPIFEADFEDNAYGYRPRRSAGDAVKETHRLICRGYTDVVDADLSKYFDSIPHSDLLRSLARRIVDRNVLRLIKLLLQAPVEERDGDGKRRMSGGRSSKRGTPQGGVAWDEPIDRVDTTGVLACLGPIWETKSETASRLRGRIERVLDAAKARGLRSGENPAAWRSNLKVLLPKRKRLTRGHHPALPYVEMPAFMADLRSRDAMAALALEFCILTATRTGETLGAEWKEIDFDTGLWIIPASRMKVGKEHRIPLNKRALDVLVKLTTARTGRFVFPGPRPGKPMSNMAMMMLLRRMGRGELTVHGFRSAFRDWAGNETPFAREVAEAALAHVIGDAAERAYRRGDALEKRRAMMEAWAQWCEPKETNVVAFSKPRS